MPALLVRIAKLPPVTKSHDSFIEQNQCLSCVTGTRSYSEVGSLQQGAVLGSFQLKKTVGISSGEPKKNHSSFSASGSASRGLMPIFPEESEKRPDCVLRLTFDDLKSLNNAETALKPLMDWDRQQEVLIDRMRSSAPRQQASLPSAPALASSRAASSSSASLCRFHVPHISRVSHVCNLQYFF